MKRKSITATISRLTMVAAGVLLLLVVPRDPWPVLVFALLSICSLAGSCLGRSLARQGSVAAFLLSWTATSLFFSSVGLLWETLRSGRSYLLQWWAMVTVFVLIISLAGTLIAFPAVGFVANLIGRGTDA